MSIRENKVLKDILTFGGLLLVLSILSIIPVIGSFTLWLFPLPFFILRVKHPRHFYIVMLIWAGFFTYILLSFPFFLAVFWIALVIGAVMGHLYRLPQAKAKDVALGGMITGLVGVWISIYIGQHLFGVDRNLKTLWENQWLLVQNQMVHSGLMSEKLPTPPMEVILPTLIFLFLSLMVFATLYVGNRYLRRIGVSIKKFPSFYEWRIPRSFFYFYFIVLLALWFFGEQGTTPERMLLGILGVLQCLFFIQGCSFAAFFLHHKEKRKIWLLAVVLLGITPLGLLIQGLGLADTGFKLREYVKNRIEKGS